MDDPASGQRAMYAQLNAYANNHRDRLSLHPVLPIEVSGVHTVFRVSPTGQLLIEFIV